MNDSIDRQKAIATADSMLQKCDGDINDYHDLMVEALEVLPSAEPEQKTGMWIVSDDKYWHTCPFCDADIDVSMGTGVYVDDDEVSHVNYCPNCGARMEVKE